MKKYDVNALENDNESAINKETLQTYFKDAYMRERERFNSMFGALEYNPPFDYSDFEKKQEPEETPQAVLEEFVTKKKYKKTKRATAAFVILTIIFLAATVFFGAKYFELF